MNKYFPKHKYNAKRTKCNLGHSHPSMLEGQYCNQLQMLQKANEIQSFDYNKRYELRVNGKLIGHHKPDFTVTTNDGKIEIHETKGMITTDFMLRKNLFEAIYPDIKYIIVK
jgi:hypothetical protein